MVAKTIYTIGHSTHSMEKFIGLLKTNGIEIIVDTRSSPYSRYAEHFNRQTMQSALEEVGIRYQFMGQGMGGRPQGTQFYDAEGYVLYSLIADTVLFKSSVETLLELAISHRIALVCGEEDPTYCHRKLLIARHLHDRDVSTVHIRGDGKWEVDQLPAPPPQMTLFEEPVPWRSAKPINTRNQTEVNNGNTNLPFD